MKFFTGSIFRIQMSVLTVLSVGVWISMSTESPAGYFCAGINVGGMIYWVVNMRRDRKADIELKIIQESTKQLERLLMNPHVVEAMEKAGLVEVSPQSRQAPEKETQPAE